MVYLQWTRTLLEFFLAMQSDSLLELFSLLCFALFWQAYVLCWQLSRCRHRRQEWVLQWEREVLLRGATGKFGTTERKWGCLNWKDRKDALKSPTECKVRWLLKMGKIQLSNPNISFKEYFLIFALGKNPIHFDKEESISSKTYKPVEPRLEQMCLPKV